MRPPNFGGENPQKSQKDEKKIGRLFFLELPGKWGATTVRQAPENLVYITPKHKTLGYCINIPTPTNTQTAGIQRGSSTGFSDGLFWVFRVIRYLFTCRSTRVNELMQGIIL